MGTEPRAATSAPCAPLATPTYVPRHPEQTVLYAVVREQLETFLARARERERPVPRFVERELRRYLECGILAHGFLRVRCEACGLERLVAFSCYPELKTIWSFSSGTGEIAHGPGPPAPEQLGFSG